MKGSKLRSFKNILVTGGAGFIGTNFIKHLFGLSDFKGNVINIDKLTYAGNYENLIDIEKKWKNDRYFFYKVDICNYNEIQQVFEKHKIDAVVHFAAESHVDRSILGPSEFIQTNIIGTFNLLEIVRDKWKGRDDVLFHHISTDEVFGSLGESGFFYEDTSYDPKSPYSASKASSDHLVRAYNNTYKTLVTISNCSNNYGPYQFPEKLIPLMIMNILEEKPLPVYGDGKNIRDWLYVEDHCSAIYRILQKGKIGETYNIGGDNEWENIKLVNVLCEEIAEKKGKDKDYYKKQIIFVKDRPGHDRRYAINCDKIKSQLGWSQSVDFDEGLKLTLDWYFNNMNWVNDIKSGEYQKWTEMNYSNR